MKWKTIDRNLLSKYDWIILGYWIEDEEEMAWQIGRMDHNNKLEFWGRNNGGPCYGDGIYPFDPEKSTHYIEISNEINCI